MAKQLNKFLEFVNGEYVGAFSALKAPAAQEGVEYKAAPANWEPDKFYKLQDGKVTESDGSEVKVKPDPTSVLAESKRRINSPFPAKIDGAELWLDFDATSELKMKALGESVGYHKSDLGTGKNTKIIFPDGSGEQFYWVVRKVKSGGDNRMKEGYLDLTHNRWRQLADAYYAWSALHIKALAKLTRGDKATFPLSFAEENAQEAEAQKAS